MNGVKSVISSLAFMFAAIGVAHSAPSKEEKVPGKEGEKVSVLFLIHAKSAKVEKSGNTSSISLPSNSEVLVFSDRPYRLAKPLPGGLDAFAKFFQKSNFHKDLPNVTFSGQVQGSKLNPVSVLVVKSPQAKDGSVQFTIVQANGSEKIPAPGTYDELTLVVDNVWDWLAAGASIVGTAFTCSAGEVATLGLATGACVAGVAESVAAVGGAASGN